MNVIILRIIRIILIIVVLAVTCFTQLAFLFLCVEVKLGFLLPQRVLSRDFKLLFFVENNPSLLSILIYVVLRELRFAFCEINFGFWNSLIRKILIIWWLHHLVRRVQAWTLSLLQLTLSVRIIAFVFERTLLSLHVELAHDCLILVGVGSRDLRRVSTHLVMLCIRWLQLLPCIRNAWWSNQMAALNRSFACSFLRFVYLLLACDLTFLHVLWVTQVLLSVCCALLWVVFYVPHTNSKIITLILESLLCVCASWYARARLSRDHWRMFRAAIRLWIVRACSRSAELFVPVVRAWRSICIVGLCGGVLWRKVVDLIHKHVVMGVVSARRCLCCGTRVTIEATFIFLMILVVSNSALLAHSPLWFELQLKLCVGWCWLATLIAEKRFAESLWGATSRIGWLWVWVLTLDQFGVLLCLTFVAVLHEVMEERWRELIVSEILKFMRVLNKEFNL